MKQLLIFAVTLVMSASLAAEPRLHRAIEPARISLDLNLYGGQLDIFYDIHPHSTPVLTSTGQTNALIEALKKHGALIHASAAAGCSLSDIQLFSRPDQSITGYQTLICQFPAQLETVQLQHYQALPQLQTIDVWLITEQWQSRQLSYPDRVDIALHGEAW